MAGLTKAQRAAKEAAAKEVEVQPEVVVKEDETVKNRCDFNSWEEYNKYTGKKG